MSIPGLNSLEADAIDRTIREILVNYAFISHEDVITIEVIDKIMDRTLQGVPPFLIGFVNNSMNIGTPSEFNYDKFEYYGDAVLGVATRKYILSRAINQPLSTYTNYYNHYISNETNAKRSKILGLDKHILMNPKLVICDGVISDVYEAFLGILELRASKVIRGSGSLVCSRIVEKIMDDTGGLDITFSKDPDITYVDQILVKSNSIVRNKSDDGENSKMEVMLSKDGLDVIREYGTPQSKKMPKILGTGIARTKDDAKLLAFKQARITLNNHGIDSRWSVEKRYKAFYNLMIKFDVYRGLVNAYKSQDPNFAYLYSTNPDKWGDDRTIGYAVITVDKRMNERIVFITSLKANKRNFKFKTYSTIIQLYSDHLDSLYA